MSEEHLYGGRPHITSTLNETVIYILTEGSLFLESGGKTVEMYPGDVHVFSFGNTVFYKFIAQRYAFVEIEMPDIHCKSA